MFRPWQRNKHVHPRAGTAIEKPARRSVINPDEVQATLAHQCKIDIDLLRFSQIISVRVRLKGSVSNAFNKKLLVSFEKKFRDRANSRVCAHSGLFLVQAPRRRKVFGSDASRALLGYTGKYFAEDDARPIDIFRCVRRGNESGLKL